MLSRLGEIFVGRLLVCTPYVPIPPHSSEMLDLFVNIRHENKEKGEVPPGYTAPFPGQHILFKWGSGPLEITCPESTTGDSPKILEQTKIRNTAEHVVTFQVDTTSIQHAHSIVSFVFKQGTTTEKILLKCPLSDNRYHQGKGIGGRKVYSTIAQQEGTLVRREESCIPEIIRLEKYGIEVRIPPNKACSAKDITVEVIDVVPPELKIKETEAIITYGLKIKAPHSFFENPVKVTMPHSAIFTKPGNAEIISYYRKSAFEEFEAIPFTRDTGNWCVVRERDLDIYFNHFCEYWFVSVYMQIFIGKRLVCTPYVPLPPIPKGIRILCVHVRDAQKKEGKAPTGYTAPLEGDQFLFMWGSGPMEITCQETTSGDSTKFLQEMEIRYLPDPTLKFKVDTTDIQGDVKVVTFVLKQSTTRKIPVEMRITEAPDPRGNSSSSSDLQSSQEQHGNTAPTVGAQPQVDSLISATTRFLTSCQEFLHGTLGFLIRSRRSSHVDTQRHELSDPILLELANQINSTVYPVSEFAVDLGFDGATATAAEQIAIQNMNPQRKYEFILDKFVLENGRGAQKLIDIFTEKNKRLLVDVLTEGIQTCQRSAEGVADSTTS